MTIVVLLDTGPLGLATHPKGGADALRCQEWLREILSQGARVLVPAIADYELRRELIRGEKVEGLARLDQLVAMLGYLPLDQEAMTTAAYLWAEARRLGQPTAPDPALDGDCLLAAQARIVHRVLTQEELVRGFTVVIATTNPKHLSRQANAQRWSKVQVPAQP